MAVRWWKRKKCPEDGEMAQQLMAALEKDLGSVPSILIRGSQPPITLVSGHLRSSSMGS